MSVEGQKLFSWISGNQGCADPDPDPCFFGQKDPDPDPLKLMDPYGSGSVPRIRKMFMKITKFFLLTRGLIFVVNHSWTKTNQMAIPTQLKLVIRNRFLVSRLFYCVSMVSTTGKTGIFCGPGKNRDFDTFDGR